MPWIAAGIPLLAAACARDTAPAAAGAEDAARPRVVALDPPQGARDVDPARGFLAVTFDRAMDPEGWSWVIENPDTAPELGEAAFDAAGRTNTVAVRLEPGRTYVVWVNSSTYAYFRERGGATAEPLRWTFTTRAAAGAAAPAPPAAGGPPRRVPLLAAHGASAPASAPRVLTLSPPNGADGVDPALSVLRARFDRPMEASWSWVSEGESFPPTTGKAYFETDGLTAALPVKLEPGRSYVVWLNSSQFQLFRDRNGIPAPPLRWTFRTRPAEPAGR
jgi:RNA polymerase sigma-70 factor (ECF subfamily)